MREHRPAVLNAYSKRCCGNLARLLDERDATAAKAAFIAAFGIIELDAITCEAAADIAVLTGARTLDSLHLAAADGSAGQRSRS